MMKTYHYTISDRLVKILIDGEIKVMEESSKHAHDEVCLAWLTINPEWDDTAFFGYDKKVLDNAGRIRITLGGTYDKHTKHSRYMPSRVMLEESAKSVGVNPEDWRVSDRPIDISRVSCIELWRDECWVEVPIGEW